MNKKYQMINIAKNQLGIDKDSYRAMIFRINRGKGESLKDCNITELNLIIKELKAKGFKSQNKNWIDKSKLSKKHPSSVHNKLLSVWIELHRAGIVRDASEKALNSFCLKNRNEDNDWAHWRFMPASEVSYHIEILKKWQKRATKEK